MDRLKSPPNKRNSMSETTCPVLKPTMAEFKDFRKFLDTKLQGLANHGIVKVVPPEGWFVGDYEKVDDILFNPIKQEAMPNEAGSYTLHIEDMPTMSIGAFRNGYAAMNKLNEEDSKARERQFWRELGKSNGNEWGRGCTALILPIPVYLESRKLAAGI